MWVCLVWSQMRCDRWVPNAFESAHDIVQITPQEVCCCFRVVHIIVGILCGGRTVASGDVLCPHRDGPFEMVSNETVRYGAEAAVRQNLCG